MKSILFLFALTCNINAIAQWEIKNFDGYSRFNKISFFDENLGFLIGDYSEILKSLDGGETWSKVIIDEECFFEDFQFINYTTMIASGYSYEGAGDDLVSKVFRSTDSGESWEMISNHPNKQFYSQWFFNLDVGLIAGYSGIYRTVDAGMTWENVYSFQNDIFPTLYSNIHELHFVNNNLGFAIEEHYEHGRKLLKTEDGGLTWQRIGSSPGYLYSINFLNANIGFVGGLGNLYKTEDGGVTWLAVEFSNNQSIIGLDFISSDIGFAIGSETGPWIPEQTSFYCSIYKTINGGSSWQTYNQQGIFYSLDFIDENIGYISGAGNLIMKTEGGDIGSLPENYPWLIVNVLSESSETLKVYPNPVKNNLTVEFSNSHALTEVWITTMDGKILAVNEQWFNNKVIFDLNSIVNGIYFLHGLNHLGELVQTKIIKM